MSKLTPFILIIFSIIAFFAFIDPEYKKVKALRAEKARYDVVLAKARSLVKKRDDLQAKYREIPEKELVRINSMIPDNLDNVKLVLDIDRMAAAYGIKVKNIAVTDNKSSTVDPKKVVLSDAKLYDSATITFSVSAPYEIFLKFLRDLEDGLRIIDITSLTVTPKDSRVYDYSVTFKTYWLK